MKRLWAMVLVCGMLICMLVGCEKECDHEWLEADCTTPKTCSECGEEKGKSLGHDWEDATCATPKTCCVCGLQKGSALEHDIQEWNIESVHTVNYETNAVYIGQCRRCKEECRKEGKLTNTHDNDCFILTPSQFAERFNMELSNYTWGRLYAKEVAKSGADYSGIYAIEIYECAGEGLTYDRENSTLIGWMYFGMDSNGEEKVRYEQKDSATFSCILGSVSYETFYSEAPTLNDLTVGEVENIRDIMMVLIATCDPMLEEYNSVEKIAERSISNVYASENGITYLCNVGKGLWSCYYAVSLD